MAPQDEETKALHRAKSTPQHKLLWVLLSISLVVALGVWVTLQPALHPHDVRLQNASPYHVSKPQRDPARVFSTPDFVPPVSISTTERLAEAKQSQALRDQQKELEALQQALTKQNDQIAKLTETVEALREGAESLETDEVQEAYDHQLIAAMTMAQLYTALKQKINDSEAFAPELKALLALPTLSEEVREKLAFFTAFAGGGIASRDELRLLFERSVRTYYREGMVSNREAAQTGMLGDVARWTTSLITIRKVGNTHRDDTDGSIIARAERHLGALDVALAVDEIGRLSVHALPYFKDWRQDAHAYLSAQEVLRDTDPLIFVASTPAPTPSAPTPTE